MGKFYIRCLFIGFLDVPIFRKSGQSEYLKIRIFGFSATSEFRFPKIRISGNPKIRIFRFPDFRISGLPEIRKSRFSDFQGIGCRFFSWPFDARHRRCLDPSKKHSDTAMGSECQGERHFLSAQTTVAE